MFKIGNQYVLGYDISNEYVQISYMNLNDDMPTTYALVTGTEEYNIPACLFKRAEVNQWFFGKEAIGYSEVEEGELVKNLWEQALIGDKVKVVEEEFDPVALLALYVKRSLSMFNSKIKADKIVGVMFSVPELTKRAIEVLTEVKDRIGLEDCRTYFEGREESIYYYIVHQPITLWSHDTLVYDFTERNLKSYRFVLNRGTIPKVAFVDMQKHDDIVAGSDNLDEEFLNVILEDTRDCEVSGAYLLGDGFDGDWGKESLKELCNKRRAFRGNNLYSKGACYAMRNIVTDYYDRNIIFLGKDKLKSNVGMKVMDVGKETYLAVLNGGDNWFDSKSEFDIILDKGNTFEIIITPLDGRNVREIEVILDGLNKREEKASRIHLKIYAENENSLRICATDMGFGEIYPSTHQLFTKQISLE